MVSGNERNKESFGIFQISWIFSWSHDDFPGFSSGYGHKFPDLKKVNNWERQVVVFFFPRFTSKKG